MSKLSPFGGSEGYGACGDERSVATGFQTFSRSENRDIVKVAEKVFRTFSTA